MKAIALLLALVISVVLWGCTATEVKEPDDGVVTEESNGKNTTPSEDNTTADDTETSFVAVLDDKIEITDSIFSDEREFTSGVSAEIYITAPKVIAPYYGENVDLLNNLIEINIDSFKNDYLYDVALNENTEGAISSSRMLVYKPYFAEDGKVSILLSCNIYIGGSAHPSLVHRGVNFDLETGAALGLNDIVKCDIDDIKDKIIEKMKENSDAYYSTEDDVLADYDISRNFLFDDEKVYIFFDEYQIGPRSEGFTIFEFTYDELA